MFVLIIFLARPPIPEDTRFHGGSVQDAVIVLAEASVNENTAREGRAIDNDYSHWSGPVDEVSAESAAAALGVKTADRDSPVVAGIVGIASLTGLRELASIFLYLLSDYGEAEEDYELVDICLRAIPHVDPHFVDAYIIRAYFYSLTDVPQAERILLGGLKWNPNDWELYNDLAWLYLRNTTLRNPDPHTALRYLKAGIMVKHPYSLRRLYAYLLAHLRQFEEAERVFLEMIDDEGIPVSDLKKAAVGLESVQRREDRLAGTVFSKVIKVDEQEGEAPVHPGTGCGDPNCTIDHSKDTSTHEHEHDCGDPNCGHDHEGKSESTTGQSMFGDLMDDQTNKGQNSSGEGHVHGPWCNH
jgi:hypothetical protein